MKAIATNDPRSAKATGLASIAIAAAFLAALFGLTWLEVDTGIAVTTGLIAGLATLFLLGYWSGRALAMAAPPAFLAVLLLYEIAYLEITDGSVHGGGAFALLILSPAMSVVVGLGLIANRVRRQASPGSRRPAPDRRRAQPGRSR